MGGGGMWFVVCIPKEPSNNKKPLPPREPKLRKAIQHSPEEGNVEQRQNVKNQIRFTYTDVDNNNEDDAPPYKQILRDILEQLDIRDAVWCTSPADSCYQVYFGVESPDETDMVLRLLTSGGIGSDDKSTVACMPCAIFYRGEDADQVPDNNDEVFEEKKAKGIKSAQQKFLKSVTARLTVAQVVEGVRAQGELNFDYVALILLAGMIAALGLMDNSVVSIIAAMLVSPLMGPIMAITFGIIIHDLKLIKTGLRTELIGLALCLGFGFFFGLTMAYFGDEHGALAWGPNTWPNAEQSARGQWRALWVGALVALPSGGGVAMAILGGNSACLVGVAISASLLPPSINCGTLWSLALMKVIKAAFQDPIEVTVSHPSTGHPVNQTTYPALMAHQGFNAYYFDNANMHKECAVMGIVSFCLTLVNILCIIISGSLFLKIKEIAPEKSLPETDRFWKHDIKVAREYNRRNTTAGSTAGDIGQSVLSEWASVAGLDPKFMQSDDPKARMSQLQTLQDILMDAEDDDVFQTVTSKVGSLGGGGGDPVRRLSRAVLPQLPKGGASGGSSSGLLLLGSELGAGGPTGGGYDRRPSAVVGNILHGYERRLSRFQNSCYANPDFSPRATGNCELQIPGHLQNRRRSSVARPVNLSCWPGQLQPRRPFSEGDGRGRFESSSNRTVSPVREEDDEPAVLYSHI